MSRGATARATAAAGLVLCGLAAATAIGCGGAAPACNGSPILCDRRFDAVTLPMTHNSYAARDRGFVAAASNQTHTITRQLADGIRGINIDAHYDGDRKTLSACHASCILGRQPLAAALGEIAAFLASHPREVLVLVFESRIAGEDLVRALRAAGLDRQARARRRGAPWPTLAQIVASGRRLYVFTDRGAGAAPWLLDERDHMFSTRWGLARPEDLDCRLLWPRPPGGIFKLVQHITNPIASPSLSRSVTEKAFFLARARRCARERAHIPNLISVDFYEVGDVIAVARALNGLDSP